MYPTEDDPKAALLTQIKLPLQPLTHLRRVDQRQGLDVLQVLRDALGPGDGVALVEAELVPARALAEPHACERVQETFVQIIRDPASVLDLWENKDLVYLNRSDYI